MIPPGFCSVPSAPPLSRFCHSLSQGSFVSFNLRSRCPKRRLPPFFTGPLWTLFWTCPAPPVLFLRQLRGSQFTSWLTLPPDRLFLQRQAFLQKNLQPLSFRMSTQHVGAGKRFCPSRTRRCGPAHFSSWTFPAKWIFFHDGAPCFPAAWLSAPAAPWIFSTEGRFCRHPTPSWGGYEGDTGSQKDDSPPPNGNYATSIIMLGVTPKRVFGPWAALSTS